MGDDKFSDEQLLRAAKRWQDEMREKLGRERTRKGMLSEQTLSSLLKPLAKKVGYSKRHPLEEWQKAWRKVVGEEFGALTQVKSYKNGFLQIGVSNAALKSEFEAYYVDDLTAALREEKSNEVLRGIKFILDGNAE